MRGIGRGLKNRFKRHGTEHQKETLRAMRREWSLDPHMP
jgi:hypothetical protein